MNTVFDFTFIVMYLSISSPQKISFAFFKANTCLFFWGGGGRIFIIDADQIKTISQQYECIFTLFYSIFTDLLN